MGDGGDCILVISIHAPVKGATRLGRPRRQEARISIHAPVKGATGCTGPGR